MALSLENTVARAFVIEAVRQRRQTARTLIGRTSSEEVRIRLTAGIWEDTL
jgi:hypothetical protein